MIKSITAREIFKKCPQVKKQLWVYFDSDTPSACGGVVHSREFEKSRQISSSTFKGDRLREESGQFF